MAKLEYEPITVLQKKSTTYVVGEITSRLCALHSTDQRKQQKENPS